MGINRVLLAGQLLFVALIFGLPLFAGAGTLAWVGGWLYLALFMGFVVALTLWLYRSDPALLRERMRGQGAGQQTWDRAFFAVMFVMFVAWLALMALDAVRWRWSYLPLWLQAAGAVVLLGSFALFFATFHANTFLSPVVRIQAERGQTVISDGPYRHVRHPMYTAFLLFAVGTTLLLGSLWGLAGAAALTALVAVRALLEERTLRRELPGYAQYMERVRYRLVPGLW